MATGCHTCGGTLTGPVGTTREASKVTMVFETVSVCGARVPVPLVTKAPEAPPTAQSVVLNWPVILRVSSLCHAPASSMLPPVQARKGAGQIRNLFQFAMLFEKSKEKSKIRTWYHKSFLSTSRVSELGRGRESLGGTTLRAYLSFWVGFQPTRMMPECRGKRLRQSIAG